jgi:hypothetical protein
MSNFNGLGYIVNNKVFFNTYLAHYESYTSKQPIHFCCYDQSYDQLDWNQEPEQSLEQLMDAHMLHLRNKYERLIFLWSGGTDSQTMYNVIRRNGIHIDEILVKHHETSSIYPDDNVKWLIANHWDPLTKITPVDEYDAETRKHVIKNDEWIFNNSGDILKFGHSVVSDTLTFQCERNHNGHNWGVITGFEKPIIVLENGVWYAKQSDRVLRQCLGHERLENFFLDPLINLKQCHLAKNTLKITQAKNKRNWSLPAENRGNGTAAYTAWARALGRHDEVNLGVSHLQKVENVRTAGVAFDSTAGLDNFDNINGESMLVAKLKQKDKLAIDYVNGFYNLRSQGEFYNYLNDTALESKDMFLKTKQIYSKPYNIGA